MADAPLSSHCDVSVAVQTRPRYAVRELLGKYCVMDRGRSITMVIAECGTRGDAERIVTALNAAEGGEHAWLT